MPRLTPAGRAGPGRSAVSDGLDILGLQPGEAVRWRSAAGTRWHSGRVARRERDGSVGVTDSRGASRSFPVDRLEVRCAGPRGGAGWSRFATGRHERSS